jgi:hypothetical protein
MINNKKEFKMPNNLKHLKYFSNYITEQDFSGAMPGEGAAPAPAPIPVYTVLFIEKGDEGGDYTYPDGSSSKRYSTYQIKRDELEKWLESTINDSSGLSKSAIKVKRDSLHDYIAGIKSSVTPDDKEYVGKFKNSIQTGMEGRKTQDTEVIFSNKEKIPTTDDIEVTFITIDKLKK